MPSDLSQVQRGQCMSISDGEAAFLHKEDTVFSVGEYESSHTKIVVAFTQLPFLTWFLQTPQSSFPLEQLPDML